MQHRHLRWDIVAGAGSPALALGAPRTRTLDTTRPQETAAIVASRYHRILIALLLQKPVLGIANLSKSLERSATPLERQYRETLRVATGGRR